NLSINQLAVAAVMLDLKDRGKLVLSNPIGKQTGPQNELMIIYINQLIVLGLYVTLLIINYDKCHYIFISQHNGETLKIVLPVPSVVGLKCSVEEIGNIIINDMIALWALFTW
ncbi:hypothetical protein ACJX0J_020454, partial [Zea mays]